MGGDLLTTYDQWEPILQERLRYKKIRQISNGKAKETRGITTLAALVGLGWSGPHGPERNIPKRYPPKKKYMKGFPNHKQRN